MKEWNYILKNFSIMAQLGLSLAMPLLLSLFFCKKLSDWLQLGEWIYLPGFLFGLGGSFMTAYKLYLSVLREEKKQKEKKDAEISVNRHRS